MNTVHPSEDIQGTSGDALAGSRIVLGITGSVAAVRSTDIARSLMRQGADVFPVMTAEATRLVGPTLLHWATGNKPVTELTGDTEHVALVGNVDQPADLLLIAPATANTIGKIAAGIDDTTVTTFATTAIGQGVPVVVVPAMHEPMYNHPAVIRNIKVLKEMGLQVLMPRVEEGKAKIADVSEITAAVVARLGGGAPDRVTSGAPATGNASEGTALKGRRVLITVGRTVEYLDPIRVFTNNSTGKMGMALAAAVIAAGGEATTVYGKGTAQPAAGAKVVNVDTSQEMMDAVHSELDGSGYDVVIAAAAVGDWRPIKKSDKKITTHGAKKLVIELEPTPKIIDSIKTKHPDIFLVAFRAQHDLTEEELLADARARSKKASAEMIAVNDVSKSGVGFGTDTNEMHLLHCTGEEEHLPMASKREIADGIVASIARRLADW